MDTIDSLCRCYTCGKWTLETELLHELYCSDECAEQFQRCVVCGRFVEVSTAVSDEVCSFECNQLFAVTQNSYVVTEESI